VRKSWERISSGVEPTRLDWQEHAGEDSTKSAVSYDENEAAFVPPENAAAETERRRMTIAIGFKCRNGVVLCTDSMESDGITKRSAVKIRAYQVAHDWGVAVACSGEADLADSFTDTLPELLGRGDYDRATVLAKLREAIANTRMSYPDSELAMLIGISNRLWFPHAELFRVMHGSVHLGSVHRHQSIGIGANLTTFFALSFITGA
jgi:hypothetical protein